jgi:hypothetical protein
MPDILENYFNLLDRLKSYQHIIEREKQKKTPHLENNISIWQKKIDEVEKEIAAIRDDFGRIK